ncbi:hypothetical protein CUMW_113150 [Citrus unshiu]|uniref:Uncharacterized protein n=1 Tax=Citrus unshiu TaxID=55188 RepID=A0A2H5P8E0_CITUN|nr:hypothetical protein CUMW_113150 [Citrus unshiu]
MMYGDPQQHHNQQQPGGGGDHFNRGPQPPQPPGPPMMRQPSASSSTLNPPEFHHLSSNPPYDGDNSNEESLLVLVETVNSKSGKYSLETTIKRLSQSRAAHGDSFAAKRMRKLTQRRAVDYTSTVVRYMQIRMWQRDSRDRTVLQATPAAAIDMLPTVAYADNPSTSFAAKFVHTSLNKNRCSINRWTPTGRRLITGSQSGEFTLWNGQSFNFEMILQAHDHAIRSMVWSHNDNWMVSGDDGGAIKYWQNNMNNVKANKSAHKESVRDLSHGHKNMVLCVKWNQNGNWVLTASKDQIIKVLYDIRAMKELESFRGHRKDVTALAWHPFHEEYFVSGSLDGSIFHWLVGHETPQVEIHNVHDNTVWDLAWHPIGYLLCSGSNDHTTKFWCRNRPGDTARDKFNMGQNQGYGEQNAVFAGRMPGNFPLPEGPTTPGPFAPGLTRNEGTIPGVGVAMPLSIPSFDSSAQGEQKQPLSMPLGAPPLPPGPHPSLLTANQQQGYQQNPPPMPPQQHQGHPQQMPHLAMPPQNMPQLQPPSHLPMLQHPHISRPPPQMPQLGMPSPMPGSLPTPSSHPMSMPVPVGMQGSMNQMAPPMQQGHYMGMNPMHSGGGAPPQVGGFPNGMQGPPNSSGPQMYPQGGAFNRPQGQMPMMPGYNPFQSGNQSGMAPPPPPGPPPHGQSQQ